MIYSALLAVVNISSIVVVRTLWRSLESISKLHTFRRGMGSEPLKFVCESFEMLLYDIPVHVAEYAIAIPLYHSTCIIIVVLQWRTCV